jgi:ABC-type transport system involved in multi-copper enzyme maturation permease subunit
MNQFKSLLWKEWREIRVFFFIALFVFVVLPLIGGLEDFVQHGRFEVVASIWTYFLGGVLAIFIGVGTVVRDLNGPLEDFWRSRPLSVTRWLIVKYFVGLVVVIFTLVVPLAIELLVNKTKIDVVIPPQLIMAWHPFVWAVLYSVGFLMACLLRRGAHAAMLSLAVMLLLYFLPEVLPPLHHLSVTWVVQESQFPRQDHTGKLLPYYHALPWALRNVVFRPLQLQFAAGMLILCLIAVGLSLLVIRRDTHIESGRRTIYWSIGGALLVLFASASFQVASNLTLLQSTSLPNADEFVSDVRIAQDHGLLITNRWQASPPDHGEWFHTAYPFKITPAGVQLESPVSLPDKSYYVGFVWRPEHPNVIYVPGVVRINKNPDDPTDHDDYPKLTVFVLNGSAAQVSELEFKEFTTKDSMASSWGRHSLFAAGDRLYLISTSHVLIFDIADPLKPHLLSNQTIPYTPNYYQWSGSISEDTDPVIFPLQQIPGLSAHDRLAAWMSDWKTFDGEAFYRENDNRIAAYHLEQLTDTTATFRKAGRYDVTPVQRLFGSGAAYATASDGFLYSTTTSKIGRGIRLNVFDVRDPQRPHPIAHFALPEANESIPYRLPDGRILLASRGNLYVVSAPKSE